jgi:hypothetical protein
VSDRTTDAPAPEPVVEPMPAASETPVTSSATPLVPARVKHVKSYRLRFGLVYAGLAAVLLAGIGVFAFVVEHGAGPAGPEWSAWQPKHATRPEMASEIAAHVAPLYRLAPGGAQLVAVQASDSPEVQNVPVEDIALRGGGSKQDVKVLPVKNSVDYTLCGLGARCKISKGTPTQARARLLRREALELALYTFKYVGGVDSVVVHIPPPPEPNTDWALFFQKSELANELSLPLARTLPTAKGGAGLVPASVVGNADQRTIERLTRARWFTSQYQQLPDGNAILVLDPVIAAG